MPASFWSTLSLADGYQRLPLLLLLAQLSEVGMR